jgi:hypothetical protein
MQAVRKPATNTLDQVTAETDGDFSQVMQIASRFNGDISWIGKSQSIPHECSVQPAVSSAMSISQELSKSYDAQQLVDDIGLKRVRGRFDNCADDNYISRELIETSGLQHLIDHTDTHGPLAVSTVLGRGALKERCRLNLTLDGMPKTHSLVFWIAEKDAFDVSEEGRFDILLGLDWMKSLDRKVFKDSTRSAFTTLTLGHESKGWFLCAQLYLTRR